MVGDWFRRTRERFEDLPPVDLEGYLADQGRNFLAETDARISRLGLPDFMASTTQKIQGLGDDVGRLYTGLEQNLSQLPSQAQQASTDFLSSTGDQIGQLGQGLGQGLGGIASDLGTGLRSAQEAQEALNRSVRPVEGPPPTAGQEVGPAGFTLPTTATLPDTRPPPSPGDLLGPALGAGVEAARGFSDLGLSPDELEVRRRLREGRERDVEPLRGITLQTPLSDVGGRLLRTFENVHDTDQALGLDSARSRGALESGLARAREAGQALGEQTERTAGSYAEVERLLREGRSPRDVALLGAQAGLLGNATGAALTALGAPFSVFGGLAGGALAGGERNLAQDVGLNTWLEGRGLPGVTPETAFLGGLTNPAGGAGVAAQAALPATAVDDLLGVLLGAGVRATRPLVEDFMRDFGPRVIKRALSEAGGGAGALGRVFDDYVDRIAARAPGGEGGALGRLVREEAGGGPAPAMGPVDQTVAQTIDRILVSQDEVAAGRAAPTPPTSEIERALTGLRSKIYGAWFDQGDSLRRVQALVERDVGRPLTEAEDAYLHFRLLAGRGDAFAQNVKDNLFPAIKGLSKDDERLLNAFLQAADDSDKAAAVGGRVELDELGRPIGPVAGEAEARSARASLAGRQRTLSAARQRTDDAEEALRQVEQEYRRTAQAAGRRNAAAQKRLPQLRAERDRARTVRDAARRQLREAEGAEQTADIRAGRAAERGERAEQRVEANVAAAESAQTERAATKGAEAAAARKFSGGVIAQPLEEVRANFVQRLGPERAQKIFDAAEGVWGFTRSLRRRMRESGGLPEEVYRAWEEQFPHYTKSDILDFLPDENGIGGKAGPGAPLLSIADLGLRRMTTEGTTRARDLPLNSVIRQAAAVEGLARRNEGANALLRLRELSPELQRLLRPAEEGVPLRAGEASLSAFVDGKPLRFVGPKEVVDGLSRFQGEARNAVVDAAATIGLAPLVRATATGVNALFIPKNAIRDAWGWMIRTGALSDVGKVGRNPGALARAYWDSFAKGEAAPDLAEMLRAGGGQTHEFFNQTPTEILRRLQRGGHLGGRVRPVTNLRDFMGAAGDVLALPFEPIKAVGSAVERAPRLAQYRLEREAGKSPQRAALAARDITMDFSRGGSFAKVVNRVVPFFNVALQSPERLLTQDLAKGNRLKTGIGLTTGILVPSLAAEAWNRSQFPEDYADVPQYLKDTGLVVMLPGIVPDDPDGTPGQRPYLWLPMPQQYAFLKVLQDQAVASAVGDDRRGWDEVLGAVTAGLSPLGEDAPASILPPALRTPAELRANYDFYRGRPIVPERAQGLPPEAQTTPATSALGRAVGGVTGRYDLPVVGAMGPAKVDYAIKSLTGGVGQQVLGAGDAVARAFGLPAPEPRAAGVVDLPVAGGLAGTVLRNQGGQTERDAYAAVEEAKQAEVRDQLARLREHPSYQNADAQQRARLEAQIADRVERAYGNRYRAIAQGRAADVLELQRGAR